MIAFIVGAVAWVIAAWLTVGVIIAAACMLYALWCRVSPGFRTGVAWVRYRTALLLNRPVPADGLPLDQDEARGFADVMRAWDLPAWEPARRSRRRS